MKSPPLGETDLTGDPLGDVVNAVVHAGIVVPQETEHGTLRPHVSLQTQPLLTALCPQKQRLFLLPRVHKNNAYSFPVSGLF